MRNHDARTEGSAIRDELHFTQSQFPESGHLVQFYETDEGLLESVCSFIGEGLAAGEAGLVVGTKQHLRGLEELFRSHNLDIAALIKDGKYVCLDAGETLTKISIDGFPDRDQFRKTIRPLVTRMTRGGTRLRIFGEMVAILWAEGKRDAAVYLEQCWGGLQSTESFTLLLGYPMKALDDATPELLGQVFAEQNAVIPGESYTLIRDDQQRRNAILVLQQKARRLEAEVELRRGIESQLRDSELELKDFLENAIDGLHRVGADGRILWANRAELAMLGYSAEEYIGHHSSEFHVDPSLIESVLSRLLSSPDVANCETQLRRKDGGILNVLINCNSRWSNGTFVYTRCLTRDITSLKRSQQAELFLRTIIQSADDAIVSKTLEGIVTSWNAAAERIFGYRADEIVGKSITLLIPQDRGDEEKQILSKIKAGQRVDHYETRRICKDGRIIDVSLSVSPVKDGEGRVVGASKIARDITDRKQAEGRREQLLQEEQRARTVAERANRMKDEFLATVSHELRTPLNAIIGWCHMLKNKDLDAAVVSRAIDTIDRNARAQAQLVEDILDVSRVITGKLQLSITRVDLAAAIYAAVDSVQLAADTKRIHIEVVADPKIRYIRGDGTRLQQIVWNLLSNAVKFTPEGGRITVRLQRSGSHVHITVADTGEGIAPEFLPMIFERFSQGDSSTTRQRGGLGLGLAIVRHLAELHGGTVMAESAGKGLGAAFTARLPLNGVPEPNTPLMKSTQLDVARERYSAERALSPTLEGVRVLIVDDNEDTLNVLAAHLYDYKASVETASSVTRALELMNSFRPHVLISDVAMPHEDGYSLISKVRNMKGLHARRVQAIALTGLTRVEDRARALSSGFDMFVPKPFEPIELVDVIAHLVRSEELTGHEDGNSQSHD